jgi:hypothetical protein
LTREIDSRGLDEMPSLPDIEGRWSMSLTASVSSAPHVRESAVSGRTTGWRLLTRWGPAVLAILLAPIGLALLAVVAVERLDPFNLNSPKGAVGGSTLGAGPAIAGALALAGTALTTSVTILGLLLKQSMDARTLRLQEDNAMREGASQRRLQLDAAMQTVKLLSLADGTPAPLVQTSGALIALANLGEVHMAVALAAELWPKAHVSSSSAVHVVDLALATPDRDLQMSAAVLLHANVARLDTGPDRFEWPSALDKWDIALHPDVRAVIAATLVTWTRLRPPTSVDDFRAELLRKATQLDDAPSVRAMIVAPTASHPTP